MSRTAEMIDAVDNALLGTFQDLNVNSLRIRSDNGSQLTLSGYEKHLRTLRIKHETIHAHTLEDNGDIESFHNSIKTDYIRPNEFRNFNDASIEIEKTFSDYNECRPHASIDNLLPREIKGKFLNDPAFRKDSRKKKLM